MRGPAAETAENTETDNFNLGGGKKVHIFIEIIIIVQIQEEWATNQEENQLPLDKVLNCNAGRHFVFANITLDCLMWVILCFVDGV